MMPLPMNEYLQQALAECYFDVQFDVIEWNTLITNWRRGAKDASANGSNAVNVTYAAMDPFFALVRFLQSSMAPPVSNSWGYIKNPEFDALVTKARQTFDPAARDALLAELHAASVDDAAFLYVAHDVVAGRCDSEPSSRSEAGSGVCLRGWRSLAFGIDLRGRRPLIRRLTP